MTRTLILCLATVLLLSGCRYWSLYQFGEQFCEYDEYIELSQKGGVSVIEFHEPVLPQAVLLRYLNAMPNKTSYQAITAGQTPRVISDAFQIKRSDFLDTSPEGGIFEFKVDYDYAGNTPLLAQGTLGVKLSSLFVPTLIEPILKSICSDDYDLSLKRLDMRFTLDNINMADLPKKALFIKTFGMPGESELGKLFYQFDFIKQQAFQSRPIQFTFTFDENEVLSKLYIIYHKYDYLLDFENKNGRLVVIRG